MLNLCFFRVFSLVAETAVVFGAGRVVSWIVESVLWGPVQYMFGAREELSSYLVKHVKRF